MKKTLIPLSIILFLSGCGNKQSLNYSIPALTYPVTKKVDVSDNYFGTTVKDPYRWLENDTSQDVAEWVKAQNEVTSGFLNSITFRDKLKERLTQLYNFERVVNVYQAGEYLIYSKYDGLRNQPVFYKRKGIEGKDEVFIDPNTLSDDGTVAVRLIGISDDKKYIAFSKSASGSDWQTIFVKETETGKELPDQITDVKFTAASWYGDGFFYSRFPSPEKGKELQAQNRNQKVYYHKLGEKQSQDILIYEDPDHPLRYHRLKVSEDKKYLFLYIAEGTDGFECHYKKADLKKGGFKPLFTGFEHKSTVVDHHNGLFFVHTDIDAPNYKLVTVDPENPEKNNWKTIIPESKNYLREVQPAGGRLVVNYIQDVSSRMYLYDYAGSQLNEIEFPMICTAGIQYTDKNENKFIYSWESFVQPAVFYSYDINEQKETLFFEPELKFSPDEFEVNQVFYNSKDNTKVPMFLVHKKGLKLNGKNPVLLYGYGGFNIAEMPDYSTSIISLVENNVVYAIANIRGGSEYGESWHKGGMLLNKQNVFNDFIAAAEYLVAQKYTTSSKLGIYGGSNGGLLVGACVNQRPDLFKVAIPAVGVMDMLRYHRFTVGFGWVPEYGSSDDSVHFKNLYNYSPLHNLKEAGYPAVMVTTSDHDDRVVPAHSFKYIATLQEMQKGKNPVLIRIETKAGHGAGKPISKVIEETADKWAFFLLNTQTRVK